MCRWEPLHYRYCEYRLLVITIILTPQHGEYLRWCQEQVHAVQGAQVEYKEPDGVEPDDLPTVHVLRRAAVFFSIIFSSRQVFLQNLHALQCPIVAELPVKKQFLSEQKLLRGGQ